MDAVQLSAAQLCFRQLAKGDDEFTVGRSLCREKLGLNMC